MGNPPVDQGELHILYCRKLWQQIEVLKDKSDFFIADLSQLVVGQFPDLLTVQKIVPFISYI
ncbi:hypothetical protein D3C87_2115110 [compost metagenome]